ncbi:MAG TPA: dihydrodipicolinate synthase family protein [Niabella sp.]|nr:dihydrodipicolinate synthase family protein [Niabella sp.]HOZ96666.1 dihydrodipicolinate synthase family protein [Niabella sp.]HQW14466.1 dihydrodipicolinate synthase family protein [Niabella sp.]HQX19881.1 dihydrodipicolinate synthase family protein [Niabella sp.]HQX42666.1 dihydrodipicolinate synthase family protein [Niabella sp.]
MQTNSLPGGLWPVMLTPFLQNNEVDYDVLKRLTEFYIKSGANGLFANCLSSEMFQLTEAERLKVIATVVSMAAQANIPVVASGTFSDAVEDCVAFSKKVYDTGVSAVVIISNQLARVEDSEDVLKQNIQSLIDKTKEIPLGIYECPYPYKRLISSSLINWLGKTGRFIYIKDTSCNPDSIQQKLRQLDGTNCSLYNANTATALSSMEMGARGLSPIGANFYPELYSFMMKKYTCPENNEMLQTLNHRLNVMEGIASKCYPFSAKLFLKERNLFINSRCRIQHENMKKEDYINLKSLETMYRTALYDFGIG